MVKTINIQTLRNAIWHIECLKKISKAINRLNVYECNYGELRPAQQKNLEKLLSQAKFHAHSIDLEIYHQGDPRGCSLYLIDETMDESTYNQGIALC